MAQDYYQALGLKKGASKDEVRKAFKKLARKYHPDVNQNNPSAEKKFKEISEAYEVLADDKKRQQYDRFGRVDGFGNPSGQGSYTYSYTSDPFGGSRGQADFGDLGDIFGDIFGRSRQAGAGGAGQAGWGFGQQRPQPQKGADTVFEIELDLTEAALGSEKKMKLTGNAAAVKVKIPAGVDTGSKIRLQGKGAAGKNGGAPGDLYLQIKVKPHEYFERKGNDIYFKLPISVVEAIDGAKIKIPTLEKSVELKIPTGSQSGNKLRLKGRGAFDRKAKVFGDFYAVLEVKLPEQISEAAKDTLRAQLSDYQKDIRSHLTV